jgi:molecular chaperone Hsp33
MNIEETKKILQLRDRSVKVISKDGKFRAVCVKNSQTAKTAQISHNLEGIGAMILARAISGATLAASLLTGEERVVLECDGNGAISKVFAEAMQLGEVRGFIDYSNNNKNISVDKIENVLGIGLLRLSRVVYNQAEPIQGVVPIQKGDIATDLAYYYNQSEQIPSAVILDCELNDDDTIKQSGGLLLQVMPGYSQLELSGIYESLSKSKSLCEYFNDGLNPQQCLKEILPFEFDVIKSTPVDFFCRCSKENFTSKLLTLGRKEVEDMRKSKQNELVCRYCNKHYHLTDDDFKALDLELLVRNN